MPPVKPMPINPDQIAALRKIPRYANHTPEQLAAEVAQYSNRNKNNQIYHDALKEKDKEYFAHMGIDRESYDDDKSYYAGKVRSDMHAAYQPGPRAGVDNPRMMQLTNLHDKWKKLPQFPGGVAPANTPVHNMFFNTMGARSQQGSATAGMPTDPNRAVFGGWKIHPFDSFSEPFPNNNNSPSPSPSPSPFPAPMAPTPMSPPSPAPMAPTPPPAQPAAPPMGKQGSVMTDKQMFKVAFLAKCIDDGLTLDEIKIRVKQALHVVEKKANTYAALADLLRTVPLLGLGAGSLIAGGGYYGGKTIIGPGIHEAFKAPLPDKEDLLKEEVINEYDRQSETIKRQAELTKRRRERDRGMSGITRY